MAKFKVNTGTREQEVCTLRRADEVKVLELDTSVFIIPGSRAKNSDDRLVVLNRVARSIIEGQRGKHPGYVFAHARAKDSVCVPVTKMYNTAWKSARERAADEWAKRRGQPAPEGFRNVRVHDLKHTHLWPPPQGRWRELRGPPGPARTSQWSHHDALLSGRTGGPH